MTRPSGGEFFLHLFLRSFSDSQQEEQQAAEGSTSLCSKLDLFPPLATWKNLEAATGKGGLSRRICLLRWLDRPERISACNTQEGSEEPGGGRGL